MAYATVTEFKQWAGGDVTDVTDDTLITVVLDAAADAIDAECFRTFTSASSATSGARTFVAHGRKYLMVDDYTGTATIDGTSATPCAVPQGRPYNTLVGTWTPGTEYTVTAQWGWPATPTKVKLANLLLARKLDQRRQSPNGVERGSDEIGFIRILGVDKDVLELLKPLIRVARSFA